MPYLYLPHSRPDPEQTQLAGLQQGHTANGSLQGSFLASQASQGQPPRVQARRLHLIMCAGCCGRRDKQQDQGS